MQEALSPRLVQLSQGCPRLHLSLKKVVSNGTVSLCERALTSCVYRVHMRGAPYSSFEQRGTGHLEIGQNWTRTQKAEWASCWTVRERRKGLPSA